MGKVSFKILYIVLVICFIQAFNLSAIRSSNLPTEPVIDGYRKWTRANQKPVQMEPAIAAMCAPAAPVRKNPGVKPNPSPHRDKFINVYVNRLAQHAMMLERSPNFPQGSIVVKEKLTTATSATPELLTVMVKRQSGYHPASNDWEFLVVSGDTKTVIERGKLEHCTACHASQRGNDFIFRNYLTASDWQKMK